MVVSVAPSAALVVVVASAVEEGAVVVEEAKRYIAIPHKNENELFLPWLQFASSNH